MAKLTAWEDAGITEDHQPSIRYEWRPNVKERLEGEDGDSAPEYLDTGQLLIRSWDSDVQQWGTATHVSYCHIDAVTDLIKDVHGTTEFVIVES